MAPVVHVGMHDRLVKEWQFFERCNKKASESDGGPGDKNTSPDGLAAAGAEASIEATLA